MKNNFITAASRWSMAIFYVLAGINHFINPGFYLGLIPPYFNDPAIINTLSGLCEILLGLAVAVNSTRKVATFGIMAMLLAFIPAHVYFIELNSCVPGGLCVPQWIGWARLLVIHPLLIWWAYSNRH